MKRPSRSYTVFYIFLLILIFLGFAFLNPEESGSRVDTRIFCPSEGACREGDEGIYPLCGKTQENSFECILCFEYGVCDQEGKISCGSHFYLTDSECRLEEGIEARSKQTVKVLLRTAYEQGGKVICGESEQNFSINELLDFVKELKINRGLVEDDIRQELGLSSTFSLTNPLEIPQEKYVISFACSADLFFRQNWPFMIIGVLICIFFMKCIKTMSQNLKIGKIVETVHHELVNELSVLAMVSNPTLIYPRLDPTTTASPCLK